MDNIFIAIGGSGTKVAQALVHLLAAGCPTRKDGDLLTSAGHKLKIWRIDPDASADANDVLRRAVSDYRQLHERLGTHWGMEIDEILYSNPLDLLKRGNGQNEVPSLEGILADTGADADKFLDCFYNAEELKIKLNRGFYQKPFIGAAVMALFAESLAQDLIGGKPVLNFNTLKQRPANFFLCGSVYGGTGACGLPVMGKFLSTMRSEGAVKNWRIAASLLAPYCLPPPPPFPRLSAREEITKERLEELISQKLAEWNNGDPEKESRAIRDLSTDEERRELVRQILLGFYADPEDVPDRARQSLLYYSKQVAKEQYFDSMYLIGKPQPDQLTEWSNGGATQDNPLNVSEVVAAVAALNFFAGTQVNAGSGTFTVASSTDLPANAPQTTTVAQLPEYQVGDENIDVERVLLALAMLCHFVRNEIPWDVAAKHWSGLEGLRTAYLQGQRQQSSDQLAFAEDIDRLIRLVLPLFDGRVLGWEPGIAGPLCNIWQGNTANQMEPIGKGNNRAAAAVRFGASAIAASTFEIGAWLQPEPAFSRGQYLRNIWSRLYTQS
jgi:hypothetical protein